MTDQETTKTKTIADLKAIFTAAATARNQEDKDA